MRIYLEFSILDKLVWLSLMIENIFAWEERCLTIDTCILGKLVRLGLKKLIIRALLILLLGFRSILKRLTILLLLIHIIVNIFLFTAWLVLC